jgi:hypothetical protein
MGRVEKGGGGGSGRSLEHTEFDGVFTVGYRLLQRLFISVYQCSSAVQKRRTPARWISGLASEID